MPFEYRYPRPALTVDCAIFAPTGEGLEVLLIERGESPFEGEWATPGGFVEIDEPVADAADRELAEETGLAEVELEPFGVFDEPGRDPRGRIVAVAHWGLVDRERREPVAATDAADFAWHPVDALPKMAFDHREVVTEALASLRARARTGAIGRGFLEEPFSFERIHRLYESLLERDVRPERLRQTLVDETGVLVGPQEDGEVADPGDRVFAFDDHAYDRLRREPVSRWLD